MANEPVKLLLGLNFFQPVGNFDSVLEQCHANCYRPVVELLERHPAIRFHLHFTGNLLEYLIAKHPGTIEKIRLMVDRGQLELVSGAFYDPIMTALRDEDVLGQVHLMNRFLHEQFACRSGAVWLSERIWQDRLILPLRQAGMECAFVDDSAFLAEGCMESGLQSVFTTEYSGRPFSLIPISGHLRRLIPERSLDEFGAYLRRQANRNEAVTLCLFDEADRYGILPGSHKHIFQDSYLEVLFSFLEMESGNIQTVLVSEMLARDSSKPLIWLGESCPRDISDYSLPLQARKNYHAVVDDLAHRHDFDSLRPFLRGASSWKNQLVQYIESRLLYSKVQRLSAVIPPDDSALRNLLWQTQSHSAYWHGIYGGAYLPHLRQALWDRVFLLESKLLQGGGLREGIQPCDDDLNGREDIQVIHSDLSCVALCGYGGALTSIGTLAGGDSCSVGHSFTRYREIYHEDKNKPLPALDWYYRALFQDHFFSLQTTLEKFSECQFGEWGDFVDQPFEFISQKSREGQTTLRFKREGGIYPNHRKLPFTVEKQYEFQGRKIRVDYLLSNQSAETINAQFATEVNLGLCGDADHEFIYLDGEQVLWPGKIVREGVCSIRICRWLARTAVQLVSDKPVTVWIFPVHTPLNSPKGVESICQGGSFSLLSNIGLPSFSSMNRTIEWSYERI